MKQPNKAIWMPRKDAALGVQQLKRIIFILFFLSACTPEFSIDVELDNPDIKNRVSSLFESSEVNVNSILGSVTNVAIVGQEAFNLPISERDELASKIAKICEEEVSSKSLAVIFYLNTAGLHTSFYAWNRIGNSYVQSPPDS